MELKDVRKLVAHLEEQRLTWDEVNQLVTKYVLPVRGRWWNSQDSDPNRAQRPGGFIMDSKATRAVKLLAAGMQGGLTPPSNRWFRVSLADKDIQEWGPARLWLDEVENRLYYALHRSNFYPTMHNNYLELSSFGSGSIYTEPHHTDLIHFRNDSFGAYAWGVDQFGKIDTNVRRIHLTAKQLAEKFGTARLSDKAKSALEKNPYEFQEVVNVVMPRHFRDPYRIDRLNKPYASIWYEECSNEQTGSILWEGGFDALPFLASRWDVVADEIYGRSAAHDALPDVKMLQELVRAQLMAIQKVVNPVMRVPANYKKRISHIPGGQTAISLQDPQAIGPLYQIQPDINAISMKVEDLRKAVHEGFFNDLFAMAMMDDKTGRTATEIMARQQEKMLILGPVVERQQSETLGPAIVRAYSILMDRGYIPMPPQDIMGMGLEIEYDSPLSRAQKMAPSQGILTLLTLVANAAQAAPTVLDKIDFDQVVDEYARMTGAPAKIVRSDADVALLRKQRQAQVAKQEQAQFALEAAKAVPAAAQQMGETYVQGQSALDRLASSMGASSVTGMQ